MEVLFSVNSGHIAKGRVGSAHSCPIARAIIETTGCDDVSVSGAGITVCGVHVASPEVARKFIEDFDNRRPVKPINIVLDVPEEALFG